MFKSVVYKGYNIEHPSLFDSVVGIVTGYRLDDEEVGV
jgi:hypothetical protein